MNYQPRNFRRRKARPTNVVRGSNPLRGAKPEPEPEPGQPHGRSPIAVFLVSLGLTIIVALVATQLFSTATQAVILTTVVLFFLVIHATEGRDKK